jgi:hypothetical protein
MRALILVGVVLAFPAAAFAQRWGRERFPDAGACFFKDAGFRGEYFCIRAGDGVERLPDDMNDAITSVRVFGRAEVVVYRDIRFNGGSLRLDHSASNLRDENWNDRISSMRVQLAGQRNDRFGDLNDDNRGRDRDRRGPSPADVDRIVRRAYQDVLGRDPDEGGLRQYRSRIIDDRWTEEQVRESLRNSPEYREKTTMTRPKAQDIVRKAYLSTLKREPDPGGAEAYIQHVLRDNWSQDDVERDLRRSPEYRQNNR